MRLLPRTLTSRLVVTAVVLVAVVSLLIATATTLAMRSYLDGRLDDQVRDAFAASAGQRGAGQRPRQFSGVGTLRAAYPDDAEAGGYAVVENESDSGAREDDANPGGNAPRSQELSTEALDSLAQVPTDGQPRNVEVPGLGTYRVLARDVTLVGGSARSGTATTSTPGTVVVGLPTSDAQAILGRLVGLEAVLTILAVLAAGGVGLIVVRRQLRPLREVADTAERVSELPLASGSIDLTDRVPTHLTDERNEIGQVGASLNALLAHVESALAARHRSEQQVRQFVADASHELRTPLATIQGYSELARQHPEDSETVLTALSKVETESVRMTALVGDLLMLARLDAGRALEREPVDLTMLLLEAVSDARVLAPQHRWRLDLPDHVMEVPGDALALHQVVTNLLTNARKYTPSGTTVTVTARGPAAEARSDAVVVRVHDDGPGFSEELVSTAFERFARGDAARTRTLGGQESGAGLGLSLVRAIVEAHHGSASLTSAPGDTAITIVLPAQ